MVVGKMIRRMKPEVKLAIGAVVVDFPEALFHPGVNFHRGDTGPMAQGIVVLKLVTEVERVVQGDQIMVRGRLLVVLVADPEWIEVVVLLVVPIPVHPHPKVVPWVVGPEWKGVVIEVVRIKVRVVPIVVIGHLRR